MSSRAEEKARRRQEREEQERAAAAKGANKRRLQLAAGALLAVALIAAVVIVVAGGGSSSSSKDTGPGDTGTGVKPPTARIGDFNEAVKTAGCTYKAVEPTGASEHTSDPVTYEVIPPSSGPHHPESAPGGVYPAGNEPQKEKWVHSLEHGRIVTLYRPGTPKRVTDQLEGYFNEQLLGTPGFQKQVMQDNTKMPFALASLAWGQSLTCREIKNPGATFDALRLFAERFNDKAPESVP